MASVPTTDPASEPSKKPEASKGSAEPTQSDTEIQLVSSLAKLQKLEATVSPAIYSQCPHLTEHQIHQLRTLLPTRLLAPLAPIVQPKKGPGSGFGGERPVPESPQALYQQLNHSARSGVNEVRRFQDTWRSPEMKAVWERVESDIRELGALLQPTGVWEVDYDEILERLVQEEKARNEQERREEEGEEREKLRSTGADWRGIVESFAKKDVPGVRVVPGESDTDASLSVALIKAGMVFQVRTAAGLQEDDMPNWQVATKVTPGRPVTKLETGIVDCLNSRGRQWDLGYLLVCSTAPFLCLDLTTTGHDILLRRH